MVCLQSPSQCTWPINDQDKRWHYDKHMVQLGYTVPIHMFLIGDISVCYPSHGSSIILVIFSASHGFEWLENIRKFENQLGRCTQLIK